MSCVVIGCPHFSDTERLLLMPYAHHGLTFCHAKYIATWLPRSCQLSLGNSDSGGMH